VGYDEGGQLTESVRRRPYSVILFDEIEKAHHDVFNVLLQLLDDGRLTDSQGRTVDFKNTVVIMTSNIGSSHLLDGISPEGRVKEESRNRIMDELKQNFRPEFLNRVDDIVFFKPLARKELEKIAELAVDEIRKRLGDRRISLELTEKARRFIVEKGYDPVYGARPLKRFLQRQLETRLAQGLIKNEIRDNDSVVVDVEREELVLARKKGAQGGNRPA